MTKELDAGTLRARLYSSNRLKTRLYCTARRDSTVQKLSSAVLHNPVMLLPACLKVDAGFGVLRSPAKIVTAGPLAGRRARIPLQPSIAASSLGSRGCAHAAHMDPCCPSFRWRMIMCTTPALYSHALCFCISEQDLPTFCGAPCKLPLL